MPIPIAQHISLLYAEHHIISEDDVSSQPAGTMTPSTVAAPAPSSGRECSDFQVRTAMELHGSGLRIGVHIHVENFEIRLKARHLSLHIYGHVNNLPDHQELHLWNSTEICCRYVHHSEEELNLGQEDSNPWTVGTCRC